MRTRLSLVSWGAALLLMLAMLPASHAFAQAGGTVIASGLNSPRGIAIGPDGSVYVAEAGTGGSQVDTQGDETLNRGNTGQITKIAPDGTTSVVARNLPSQASREGETTGAEGLIYANGYLWTVTSIVLGPTPNPGEGSLLKIDPNTGAMTVVADLAAFEIKNNPDNLNPTPDSDPYDLALGSDGMIYVADAAANDVLKVNPNTGEVSLLAVIPGIDLPAAMQQPGGNPDRGGAQQLDPVPTGLDFGPDGALYVSLLSGGPFPEGAAKVVRVGMDGKVSDAVNGLTMLTDIKYGADGAWYVVTFAVFDLTSNPPGFKDASGQVWRITADGQRQPVASGLNFPNKLAFDQSGNMYVSVFSAGGPGQVLKFANVIGGSSVTPGMPTTGEPMPFDLFIYAGIALLLVGFVVRRRANSFNA